MSEEKNLESEPAEEIASGNGTGDLPRRDFIGAAALGVGGAASGISFLFHKYGEHSYESQVKGWREKYFGGDKRIKTGHIGVGNRGGSLLRTALQVPGSMPVAVCDKQPSKLKDFKKSIEDVISRRDGSKPKVETYDDYRRLLDNKDVEAVFIATPHYLHGPMAIDAVEAGKHVYCEKAMAFTIGENQDIVDLIEGGAKAGPEGDQALVFQVGHQRHYSPLYQKVANDIHGDRIGEVATIRAQWNQNDKISRPAPSLELERIINWRLYSEYSGGLTTEFATHQIDVANWFFGEGGSHVGVHPHSVRGYGGVDWYGGDGRDTHDNIHLIFTYKVPAVQRDAYGRVKKDGAGKTVYEKDASGGVRLREVTFDYMCTMANAHLGPSEMMLGRYGTIQVSLAGGEFWKEKKALKDPSRIAEGTNPRRSHQKSILKSGATMAKLGGTSGEEIKEHAPVDGRRPLDLWDDAKGELLLGADKHWSHFIEPIEGAYDKIETLLAVESFHKCVRLARDKKPFDNELKADAIVGMNSAVAALMANIAMREDRTVYWDEFFPKSS